MVEPYCGCGRRFWGALSLSAAACACALGEFCFFLRCLAFSVSICFLLHSSLQNGVSPLNDQTHGVGAQCQ